MSPYIGKKFIRFLPYIGSLFLPFVAINTLAIGEKNTEQKTQNVANEKWLNKSDNRGENNRADETAGFIAQNIQTVAQVLSSSPSELTEQAKSYATSYALGKINGVLSGETQKWLSQFGTAKINFALDRKGKLDNGSLDLLLPLYDNKADWLTFSQFGYRHKDSRHTLNVGLGGRYFTPDWMYGLNTFFDHDITGKNQRLGVGGEAWTDYVKLSTNTYWRLSKWRQSQDAHDWEERPASGFDLLGEFYLPAYPNLGGKLGFEQYYGDNVVLFNRDSKQKDPSLGRVGLNYTPVPLLTMGVDYKYGGSGRSETLFQANLNYRFGVPFGAQFSPDSVASARTLAGSRYDLVERNNHIVLDHRKKEVEKELQLTLPQGTIVGYSQQHWPTPIPVAANIESRIKRIIWQADEPFTQNGGSITSDNKQMELLLPHYVPNGQNTHAVNILAEDNNGKLTKPVMLNVTVQPLDIKQFKTETIPASADGKESYRLLATLVQGAAGTDPIRNALFKDAIWSFEPQNNGVSLVWENPSKTNDNGQLQATISSAQPLKDINVFLELPGMAKKHLGDVSFGRLLSDFNVQSVKSPVRGSLFTGNSGYIFTALVTNKQGEPLKNQKVDVKWYPVASSLPDGVILSSTQDTTNDQGQLFATLTSTKPAKDIKVGVSIDGGQTITYVDNPITFINNINAGEMQVASVKPPVQGLFFTGNSGYTFTTVITDKKNKPLQNQPVDIKFYPEQLPDGVQWLPVKNTTDDLGQVFATLISSKVANFALTDVSVDGGKTKKSIDIPVTFVDAVKAKDPEVDSVTSSQKSPLFVGESYTFTAVVKDKLGQKLPNQKVDVKWLPEQKDLPDGMTWSAVNDTTSTDGNLTATLTSTLPTLSDINVSVSVDNGKNSTSFGAVAFEPAMILKNMTSSLPSPIMLGGKDNSYTFTVVAYDNKTSKPLPAGQKVDIQWYPEQKDLPAGVTWSVNETTGANGELTAVLSSTKEAQDINVAASVYGPEQKVSFNQNPMAFLGEVSVESVTSLVDGKVLAGGKGYTFQVYLTDKSKQPLKNQSIDPTKIQWDIDTTDKTGMQLSSSQTGQYKTNEKGYLFATLTSSKAADNVKVKVTMNGASVESQAVSFIGDINLDDITVVNPPTGDLDGNGSSGYQYQTIVTTGGNNTAVDDLNLANDYEITWGVKDSGSGTNRPYHYEKLVGNELKFNGTNSITTSTGTKGTLTATLTSLVGLDDVLPTLTLTPKSGSNLVPRTVSAQPKQAKNFKPLPNTDKTQVVGIRVFDRNGQAKPQLHGQGQPDIILDQMLAELWDVGNRTSLFDAQKETATAALPAGQKNTQDVIKTTNEQFQFVAIPAPNATNSPFMTLDPTNLNMTVINNDTGAKRLYTYTMKPAQIFVNLREVYNLSSTTPSPWNYCNDVNRGGASLIDPLLSDVWSAPGVNPATLVSQYPDLSKWTIMEGATNVRVLGSVTGAVGVYSLDLDNGQTSVYDDGKVGDINKVQDAFLCRLTK